MEDFSHNITKSHKTAGADERTPSKSQYFSWINNTNEGSTEEQTLKNLEYFRWLRDTFGMGLDIYAWDAGNLDGSNSTYETLDSQKLKSQYPNGYAPIAEAVKNIGAKLGVWCGPDGFGNTPHEEAARHELMVSLCRDYEFGLFKMDAVCSELRAEKQDAFISMMKDCRKYSPELILLNHRLDLGRGMPYGTTTLLGGDEAYIDVNMFNKLCAPHHREYMFHRMNPDPMTRLTEDHGVCISSCIDYFEDELVLQAFRRSLILAPEIYANPWLIRDEEHARLARIFNLHRTYRDILLDATELPLTYGWHHAISRGNGDVRFLTLGNVEWEALDVFININDEVGIARHDGEFVLSIHHPYEKFVGKYRFGDRVKVTLPPFRAVLIELARADKAYPMLTNCSYEVLHEIDGVPDKVKLYEVSGKVEKLVGGVICKADGTLDEVECFDNREAVPMRLETQWESAVLPSNSEALYECAMFAMDNDSLEARSVKRSGETKIPQVKAARDAFFHQRTYMARGCESRFAFDGNDTTFFDGSLFGGGLKRDGGCTRIDFGDVIDTDSVIIEYFDPADDSLYEIPRQKVVPVADTSCDLSDWSSAYLNEAVIVGKATVDAVITCVHNIVPCHGVRRRVIYNTGGKLRYVRIPTGYHHIYHIYAVKNGKRVAPKSPKALNMYPSFRDTAVKGYKCGILEVPADGVRKDSFISVGIEKCCGSEGVFVVAEFDGKLYGCPDRSPSYLGNPWESPIGRADFPHYTFYLPIKDEMKGKKLKLHVLEMSDIHADDIVTYICDSHRERDGIIAKF
ncbi:MAG: hypothetical protein IKM46_02590 [Clostridia bacterium]|nr:hypothetical protein [Clostridia bacterium]